MTAGPPLRHRADSKSATKSERPLPEELEAFLSAALGTVLTPQAGARAAAVAGTIRADGATVAAKLLLG